MLELKTEGQKKAYEVLKNYCSQVSVLKTETAVDTLFYTKLDDDSITTALLYIPFTHKHISSVYVLDNYSEEILVMLTSLEKLHKIEANSKDEEAENIRKMFFALTKDVRVIFVKLAYVLAEMKNMSLFSIEEQKQKASLVLNLFAPLAARLGATIIKSELEDNAFRVLHPQKYREIEKQLNERFSERSSIVDNLKKYLAEITEELGISCEIMGRKKHINSIYKKMANKGQSIDEIYDLVAVRVLVNTVTECYSLLGKIHGDFTPLQGRFKDYISMPKSNGYQSLHTTIMYENIPVEIQIRTFQMHREAEFGVAAHWLYKEKRSKQDSLDTKLGWLRQIMDENANLSSEEVIDVLKTDIYDGEIFVQTPKGKVVHLPEKSTPIDFAYAIHSEVGNHCVGAKINDKMVPITTVLSNGDIIEIITNPASKGPSRDWLKLAKTMSARTKIRTFFKKEMREDNIKLGKSMLDNTLKTKNIAPSMLSDKDILQKLLTKYLMNDLDELYAAVGNSSISANVITTIVANTVQAKIKKEKLLKAKTIASGSKSRERSIIVEGADNMLVVFGDCCSPIPNDEIVGFVSRGRGLIIHRADCVHVKTYDPQRLLHAEWKESTQENFMTSLAVVAKNKATALTALTNLLIENKISLSSLNVDPSSQGLYNIRINIQIKNKSELDALMTKINLLESVVNVYRE